jgi:hypothetical protein
MRTEPGSRVRRIGQRISGQAAQHVLPPLWLCACSSNGRQRSRPLLRQPRGGVCSVRQLLQLQHHGYNPWLKLVRVSALLPRPTGSMRSRFSFLYPSANFDRFAQRRLSQ